MVSMFPNTIKDSHMHKEAENKIAFPKASIGSEDHVYFSNRNYSETYCLAASNSVKSTSDPMHVGLDYEWSAHDKISSITSFLQILIPNEKVIVINFSLIVAFIAQTFQSNLKLLLENNDFIFTGRCTKG